MGCQSEVVLADNLTFSITTHDADTGALTDCSAAPAYRVYEDETATAILTGTMAVLDTGNTTGFYTELIACTTANGFEVGKSYTLYIEATVDGITGGIAYGFTVKAPIPAAVWAYVVGATYTAAELLRGIAAACFGKMSGGGTVTETFRDPADTKNVLVATVSAVGDRSAVTKDLT
jgi:hypothetical protein